MGLEVTKSPGYSGNRPQPRGQSLAMEKVLETTAGQGRAGQAQMGQPGRPGWGGVCILEPLDGN